MLEEFSAAVSLRDQTVKAEPAGVRQSFTVSACWRTLSRVNAVSTSPSCSSGVSPLLPQRRRRRAQQQRERGSGEEGEGLKGVLFEGKGRSQSPVHRLSGVGGGAMGGLLELKVL